MRLALIIVLPLTLAFVGCTPKEDAPAAGKDDAPAATAVTLEVACGHCIYKMEGLTACTPACKIGDKVVLLEAEGFDGKALMDKGGCEAAVTATAEGKIEGDKFVATNLTFK